MSKVTIEVKRPEGHIETVDISKNYRGMGDKQFAVIKAATLKAGKGECLSYTVIKDQLTAAEKAEVDAEDKKIKWFIKHGYTASDF